MYYISVSVTLLTLLAAMYLFAKTNKEELGKFFKILMYIVVIAAFLLFLCQLSRGFRMMCSPKGECGPRMEMGMGMHHQGMMMKGHDCKMECKDMKKCEMEEEEDDDDAAQDTTGR